MTELVAAEVRGRAELRGEVGVARRCRRAARPARAEQSSSFVIRTIASNASGRRKPCVLGGRGAEAVDAERARDRRELVLETAARFAERGDAGEDVLEVAACSSSRRRCPRCTSRRAAGRSTCTSPAPCTGRFRSCRRSNRSRRPSRRPRPCPTRSRRCERWAGRRAGSSAPASAPGSSAAGCPATAASTTSRRPGTGGRRCGCSRGSGWGGRWARGQATRRASAGRPSGGAGVEDDVGLAGVAAGVVARVSQAARAAAADGCRGDQRSPNPHAQRPN